MKKTILYITILVVVASISSCRKKGCTDETATNYDTEAKKDDGTCEYLEKGTNDLSVLESLYYSSATTFTVGDDYITITSTGEPDHKSMYYPSAHALYEDYDEPTNVDFKKNPNEIGEQDLVFTIPRYPVSASTKSSTDMGAFGIAINGVVFFNQEAAPGDDILDELNTFDQYEGHPAGTLYHYHIEPIYLTSEKGNEAFLGILLDGFPIYGTHENGVEVTNDDLDDYHGHTTATAEFPDGIYHYHITTEFPWINGGQFYGAAGSYTN